MEWIEPLMLAIQQLGFPVACVVALFILLYREMEDRKSRDAETAKLLAENTAAIKSIRQLIEHLHGGEIDDKH